MTRSEQALELARRGFYVFPITPGQKAPPLIKDFPGQATRSPGRIADWWTQWPDANIGISTSIFGESEALVVVDVDNKGGKDGDAELLRLELEGWSLPGTYEHRTPTGGRHLLFRTHAPVRQGVNVLGPALDVRSQGGYVVGPGSAVASGLYTASVIPLASAPAWLLARCGCARVSEPASQPPASINSARAEDRAIRYLRTEAAPAIEGTGGDAATYRTACRVKDFGISEAQCAALMQAYWNSQCEPPWSSEELRLKVAHAYKYGIEPIGTAAPEAQFQSVQDSPRKHPFAELNREYAFVMAGGGAHILWETTDVYGHPVTEHLTITAFHAKFANAPMTIGKRTKPISEWWMEDKLRRSYDGIVFLPGEDREVCREAVL